MVKVLPGEIESVADDDGQSLSGGEVALQELNPVPSPLQVIVPGFVMSQAFGGEVQAICWPGVQIGPPAIVTVTLWVAKLSSMRESTFERPFTFIVNVVVLVSAFVVT